MKGVIEDVEGKIMALTSLLPRSPYILGVNLAI